MSRSVPYVEVSCDGKGCNYATEVEVYDGFKLYHVDVILEAYGWIVDGDNDYCPRCAVDVGRDV